MTKVFTVPKHPSKALIRAMERIGAPGWRRELVKKYGFNESTVLSMTPSQLAHELVRQATLGECK